MNQDITEAIKVLNEGGTILYPTDTIWGIGCLATEASAVEKIFQGTTDLQEVVRAY